MKAVITGTVVAFVLGVTAAAAQDSTAKSRTKISGEDAHAVTMRGCLQQTSDHGFVLLGGITAAGNDLKSKSKVTTDADKDDRTVKSRTETKIDNDHKHVATSGLASSYEVTPRAGVDLASHAGQQVEIMAMMIDPRTGGDKTADVTIKDQTKVDRDNAPDAKVQSKTKAEIPRGATAQLMAMSVKSLGRSCE